MDLQQIFNADNIIESVCEWNKARYEQEYNHDLTVKLLCEEDNETKAATDLVEKADGHGDVLFVAIGAMWKQGLEPDNIIEIMDILDNLPVPSASLAIAWFAEDPNAWVAGVIATSAFKALTELCAQDSDAAIDIIRAICISNHTKEVKKTEAHVKANTSKGISYVPPTKAIEAVLIRKGVI